MRYKTGTTLCAVAMSGLLLLGCGEGSGEDNATRQTSDTRFGNNIPISNPQDQALAEDTTIAITLVATDADADALVYTIVTPPTHGSLQGTQNHLTYIPNPDYNGADSFSFRVNDGQVDSNTATVSLTITPVNDTPIPQGDTASTDEDTPVTIAVLTNDTDIDVGDVLHIASVSTPAHGTAMIVDDQIHYTPSQDYHGTDSFTYIVSDGNSGTGGLTGEAEATVDITILSVNDTPIAHPQSQTLAEDTNRSITLIASDVDQPDADFVPLVYTIVTPPTHGSLQGTQNHLTYIPNPDYNGADSFSFKTNDGQVDSNTATVSLTITPVNDTPIPQGDTATTDEDTPVTIAVLANDTDIDVGDVLHIASVSTPAHGTATIVDDQIHYTPSQDYHGTDSFTYIVSDGNSGTGGLTGEAEATVDITILSVNDTPIAHPQSQTLAEDTNRSMTLIASDVDQPDADFVPLVYTIVTPPTHGSLQGTQNHLTYIPNPDYNGADSFSFRVNDGQVDSNTATVSLTITPVNDTPIPQGDTASTDEDTPVVIAVLTNDTDIDVGDVLHIASVSTPAHGTATIVDDQIHYTPSQDYHGTDSFSYIVSDGNSGTGGRTGEAEAEVNLTVISVNDVPVAEAGEDATIVLSESTVLDASASYDVDGDVLTYRWIQGDRELSTNRHYTYEGKEVGRVTLTLEVEDPLGLIGTDTVTVEVTEPHNETPTEYRTTFVPLRPLISDSARMAMDADMREMDEKAQSLIDEAEAIIAAEGFVLDTVALTPAQKAEIERRKAKIQEELDSHEN